VEEQDDKNPKTTGSQSDDAQTRSMPDADPSKAAETPAALHEASPEKASERESTNKRDADGKQGQTPDIASDAKQTLVAWSAANIPAYELAIEQNCAWFEQVTAVHFGSKETFNPDQQLRNRLERYIKPIHEAFEQAHGRIRNLYWCSEIVAGVAITSPGQEALKPLDQAPRSHEANVS
jgi:hypothetical protein